MEVVCDHPINGVLFIIENAPEFSGHSGLVEERQQCLHQLLLFSRIYDYCLHS